MSHDIVSPQKFVSVVIVTKDRERDLVQCLCSLIIQKVLLDELIVINNNSLDNTTAVIREIAKAVKFPIRHVLEKREGYPAIYNRGLKEANTQWVVFIDDDCVADISWYANIKKAIKKNQNAAAIMGLSKTYHDRNIYSLATFLFNFLWKENGTEAQKVVNLEVLDNKNIVYNQVFLKKHKLTFDESRSEKYMGASEDCDLGKQIQENGGIAIYDKSIVVSHKDPTSFMAFLNKMIRSLKGYRAFQEKWEESVSSGSKKKLRLRSYLATFLKQYPLSSIQKNSLIVLLFFSVLIQRWIEFWPRFMKYKLV